MEHNKYNFKEGDRVLADSNHPNKCEVKIISFTPNKMFSFVEADDGYQWELMTNRLSPIEQNTKQ